MTVVSGMFETFPMGNI